MRHQRILHLIGDLTPAGAEKVVVTLANGLINLGYEVAICAREGGSLLNSLHRVPVFINRKRGLLDPRHLLRLCRLARRHRFDLIHSHLFGNDLYAFLAGSITRTATILTVHGEDSFLNPGRRRFYRVAAKHVSKIVAVSKSLYERLVGELGISPEKVALIPNGIDSSWFLANDNGHDLRAALNLPAQAPIVGAVGRITPVKGYDLLL